MRIYEAQFKLKPSANEDELLSQFNEVWVPLYRKIPGCISANIFKYSRAGDSGPEWDYAFVEVWESEEAHKKALSDKYIGSQDSELGRTGAYDKIRAMMDKLSTANAALVASSE